MFALKFPASLPPPRRADRTRLPAALAALLVLLLAVQLLLPSTVVLPDAGLAPPLRLRPVAVAPRAVDPEIALRPLFAPGRRETYVPGVAEKSAPLEGARAVGLITARGGARLFLQAPDGRTSAIAPGGVYRGWQLVRIGPAEVAFRRGAETVTLPITASVPPVSAIPAAAEAPEEEEAQ